VTEPGPSASVPNGAVILLVEDEAAMRALFRATLSRADDARVRSARVIEAPDLATARRLLATDPPHAVVLDARLPDGDGLDLARELHAANPGGGPRVIISSASVLPDEQTAALATGADLFLAKPYRTAELTAALASLLG
jgi:DNA-binding response OmpR family regulator